MDDAVAVALEFAAIRMREFGISPAAALLHRKAQAAQPVHCWDSEPSIEIAALLTALRVLVRSGSTS